MRVVNAAATTNRAHRNRTPAGTDHITRDGQRQHLEQAREGVEDYEYLYLLRGLLEEAERSGQDTTAAKRAIEQASGLVTIPNVGGRHSAKILPDPRTVYRVKETLGRAIEQYFRKNANSP